MRIQPNNVRVERGENILSQLKALRQNDEKIADHLRLFVHREAGSSPLY